MTILLITYGKHDTTDSFCIKLFSSKEEAMSHAKKVSFTGKYWCKAEIVTKDQEIYL